MRAKIAALGVVVLLGASGVQSVNRQTSKAAPTEVRLTGTFSSMSYHAQSGDILGAEVKLVPGSRSLVAIVQLAEGAPEDPYVAEARLEGNRVSFRFPALGGGVNSFEGVVLDSALVGTFTYRSGSKESVRLRRNCGFWDH